MKQRRAKLTEQERRREDLGSELDAAGAGDWDPWFDDGSMYLDELEEEGRARRLILGWFRTGKVTNLFGKESAHKTWIVAAAAAEEMHEGRKVIWLDAEMGGAEIHKRLERFGVTPQVRNAQLGMVIPHGPISKKAWPTFVDVIRNERPSLIVGDSVTAFMELFDLDPMDAKQVQQFLRTFVRPLRPWEGVAVVLLDHEPEKDERKPFGTGRKKSGVDGVVHVKATQKLHTSHSRPAMLELEAIRDRDGVLPLGKQRARIEHRPGGLLAFVNCSSGDEEAAARGTGDAGEQAIDAALLVKLSQAIEAAAPGPLNVGQCKTVAGRRSKVVPAHLTALETLDCIRVVPGPNKSRNHFHVKPFDPSTPGRSGSFPAVPCGSGNDGP